MRSIQDEEILIGEVLEMKIKGFEASKNEVLPGLYQRVYGRLYNHCPACIKEGFDNLVKWAEKRNSLLLKPKYMKYKFKNEYRNSKLVFLHQGARVIVTADNLTDEKADILLAVPKYAHVLEPTGEEPEETASDGKIVKAAKPVKTAKVAKVEKTGTEDEAAEKTSEAEGPNGKEETGNPEVKGPEELSASTSTGQPTAGKGLKKNAAKAKGK